MIRNFDDVVGEAAVDKGVNIAIGQLTQDAEFCFYGTQMKAGSKVGCHYHKEGSEVYHILEGEGEIYLADIVSNNMPVNHCHFTVKKGDTFSVPNNTAHQLKAITDLQLLFSCPQSHLNDDRYIVGDLT